MSEIAVRQQVEITRRQLRMQVWTQRNGPGGGETEGSHLHPEGIQLLGIDEIL